MLVAESFGAALALLFCGLAFWGTWGIVLKSAELEYEVSTVYFILGQTVLSCIVCLTLGMVSTSASEETFVEALGDVDGLGALAALCGGALIAFANALLTRAISIGGVAVAFPAVIGSGLVGGMVLNYTVDPKGDPALLFSGLTCCVLALACNIAGYKMKMREDLESAQKSDEGKDTAAEARPAEESPPNSTPERSRDQFARLFCICLMGGMLSSLWSPVSLWASTERNVGSYEILFFFNFGQPLVIPFIILPPLMSKAKLQWGSVKQRALAFVAGFLNVGGLVAMFVAGEAASYAMAFGILQCAPLIASLWGLYFGEMRGARRLRIACFVCMLFMYSVAIAFTASSQV